MRPRSGFRIAPNSLYIGKITMTSHLSENSSHFFWPYSIFLVKFSYWPKFHVNIMTGVTKIFAYKGLTRNLEIVNTPVWVLPSVLRLEQVRDTEFGPNVSNKMLLNAPKCQGYGFYRFWVIKGKPTGGR